jgi:Mg-chelatase subunit ChlD
MKLVIGQRGRPVKRLFFVLWFLVSIAGTPRVVAQDATTATSNPSLTGTAGEVKKAGFSLKPTGLATSEWPTLRLDFSIDRDDRTSFRNLTLADVQPKVDGQLLALSEGDLKLRDNESSSVLLLLDGSGSMTMGNVNKLRAAKQALMTLIDNLGPTDRIALVVFDDEPRVLVPVTADKEVLKKAIEDFTIRKEHSRYTMLYDAVDFALREAQQNRIKNILLISDGWEDTPDTRNLLSAPAQLEALKQEREQKIIQTSRSTDTRVFTVAIGDEHGRGLSYVDRAALANISKGASGGAETYIEITDASANESFQQSDLLNRLRQTLDDLRQSFHYAYSLTLHIDRSTPRDEREHKLWVGFTVGDNPRIQLPVEYTYAWAAVGPPVVKGVSIKAPVFIQSAPRNVRWQQLLVIYVGLLTVLLAFAVVPAISRRLASGGKALQLHKAIVVVGRKSPLVGSACPNEGESSGRRYLIKEGDVVLICPNARCKTAHHLSCWRFNEHRCMIRLCEHEMIVPSKTLENYGLMERELS